MKRLLPILFLIVSSGIAINVTGQVLISGGGSINLSQNVKLVQRAGYVQEFCAERNDTLAFWNGKWIGGTQSGGRSDTYTSNLVYHKTPSVLSTGSYKIDIYYNFSKRNDSELSHFYFEAEYVQGTCTGFSGLKVYAYNYSSMGWDEKWFSSTSCTSYVGFFNLESGDYVLNNEVRVRFTTSDVVSGGELWIDYQYLSTRIDSCAVTIPSTFSVRGELGIGCGFYNQSSSGGFDLITQIAGISECARVQISPFNSSSLFWTPNVPILPCDPALYYVAPDFGINYLCCSTPNACAINGKCVDSGTFEGDYCCYNNSRFEFCPSEGTVYWRPGAYKTSVCYSDPVDDIKSNDCSTSSGCRTDISMQDATNYPSNLDSCFSSPTSVKGCDDGACDEDDDVLYCCDGPNCYSVFCNTTDIWVFGSFNVSMVSPSPGEIVSRSDCSAPENLNLNAQVQDSGAVLESNVNINTSSGLCSKTGSAGDYYCDYNPANDIIPGSYAWNVSYWRTNSSYRAFDSRTVEVRGCLSQSITGPSNGTDVYRSTCGTPSTADLTVTVIDENSNTVNGASVVLNMSGTTETCVFNDLTTYYSCTYNPSNSLDANSYSWNTTASKQYYYSNVSDSRWIDVYGCVSTLVHEPLNNSVYDRGETIVFNVSLVYDNGTRFSGSLISTVVNKQVSFQNWFLSDNGTYDYPAGDGYYNNPYVISSWESDLGNWRIVYIPSSMSHLSVTGNSSYHRVDDISVAVNYSGDAQFLFVQGNASYVSGVETLTCTDCVNVTITDSRGVEHYYIVSVGNNYFSKLVDDKPLRAGTNTLIARVDTGQMNGTSSTLNLVVDAKITYYDSDSNACLDGGRGQDVNYTVSVQNNGTVKLSAASVSLEIYNSSDVLKYFNQSSEKSINPGATVNFTGYYNLSASEATGLYGLRFFVTDPQINNGFDIVRETNTSSSHTGMRLFRIWKIINPADNPGQDASLTAGEAANFNITAQVDTGVGINELTSYCSDNQCANLSVGLAGGLPKYSSYMPVSGDYFSVLYAPDDCEWFVYDMNVTEKENCGLDYSVSRGFYVTCKIFVEDFTVSTSTEINQLTPSALEVVNKGDGQIIFSVTFRETLDITDLHYVQVEIRDENGFNVGTWFKEVADLDDPEWQVLDNKTAMWSRAWNVNDLSCGKYTVYTYVNNTKGESDEKSYEFVLEKIIAYASIPEKVIIGSDYELTGSITSCTRIDGSSFQVNLSNVKTTFNYEIGSSSYSYESGVSSDGAFNYSLIAPTQSVKLVSNTTNLTLTSLSFPGCTVDCDSLSFVPLDLEFVRTSLSVEPASRILAAGTPGDKAYMFTVFNPSSLERHYSLEIFSDELGAPAALSDASSPFMNLTLKAGEEKVGTIDIITALSGVYVKNLVLRSYDFPADNSSVEFEARINAEVRSVIFTYNIIPGLDVPAVFILFFLAIVMFSCFSLREH